jgi:hypothetical protein
MSTMAEHCSRGSRESLTNHVATRGTKDLERSIHGFSAARGGARLRIAVAFLCYCKFMRNISDKQNKKRKAALDWYAGHDKFTSRILEGLAAPRGWLSHEGRFGRRRGSRSMINGTCRTIVSNSALGIFDNPIGSELTQPRANIAGRYTQARGNFLCREAVGRAPQDIEDTILKFRHYISPNLGRFSKATNPLFATVESTSVSKG